MNTATLEHKNKEEFKVLSAKDPEGICNTEIEEVEDGYKWNIAIDMAKITSEELMSTNRFMGTILIETDYPEFEEIELPYFIRL